MQSQHQDPHDTIATQLRALTTPRTNDLPEPSLAPESSNESPLDTAPLNDNTGDIRTPTSRVRSGRGAIFLLMCAGAAAIVAWHFYGDQAKHRFSKLVPQFFTAVPTPTPNASAAEPQDVTSQAVEPPPDATPAPAQGSSNAASATSPPPEMAPTMPAAETSPTPTALPPEVTQSLEVMSQEIASLKQTVKQLRASQQQLNNDVAKISAHAARHKPAGQAAKSISRQQPRHAQTPAVASRPVAPSSPPQIQPQRQIYPQGTAQRETYTPPPAPMQLPPQPGDRTAPRPPMPLQ